MYVNIIKYTTMEIAVISDLHLGSDIASNRFGHDDYEFLKFLSFLESNFERIILLGDIFETLMPHQYGCQQTALKDCLLKHPEISKRFLESPIYSYIHGNHDLISANLLKAPEELRIDVDGQHLLFTHGHRYDYLIKNARFLSELGIWLGGWILRAGFLPLYKLITTIETYHGDASLNKIKCKFRQLAIEEASQRNADIIITGHTHIPAKSEHSSKLYLNSGTCSEGKISFLSIDTKHGNYQTNESW